MVGWLCRFERTGDRFERTGDRFERAGDRFERAGDRFERAGDRFLGERKDAVILLDGISLLGIVGKLLGTLPRGIVMFMGGKLV